MTDDNSDSDSVSEKIKVKNVVPIAKFNASTEQANIGILITFNAKDSWINDFNSQLVIRAGTVIVSYG